MQPQHLFIAGPRKGERATFPDEKTLPTVIPVRESRAKRGVTTGVYRRTRLGPYVVYVFGHADALECLLKYYRMPLYDEGRTLAGTCLCIGGPADGYQIPTDGLPDHRQVEVREGDPVEMNRYEYALYHIADTNGGQDVYVRGTTDPLHDLIEGYGR